MAILDTRRIPSRRMGRLMLALPLVASLTIGCAAYQKRRQLEAVARDWCLTIRASQVIPVYPLTEDLQPGDVFLVLESIPNQHKQYIKKGFLPLDQHAARLSGFDYKRLYRSGYGIDENTNTPIHWQFPASDDEGDDSTDWVSAPRAAFPNYTFEVKSGGGINVGVPIQSIPVGLSMIKADGARGSVSIADSYTYGLPFDELAGHVVRWAGDPTNKAMLASIYAANSGTPIYLRVVSRVYLTGRVLVSLTAAGSFSGRADAGSPKDFDIPDVGVGIEVDDREEPEGTSDPSSSTAENYTAALETIGGAVDAATPGATVKVAWATNRSVSMSETFARPLVIGYLGFDFPVLSGGYLGTPVATKDQLLDKRLPSAPLVRDDYLLMRGSIESLEDSKRDAAYAQAAETVSSDFEEIFRRNRDRGMPAAVAFAKAKTGWLIGKTPLEQHVAHVVNAMRRAYDSQRQ